MRHLVLHKFNDPGHGWLRVKLSLLRELGIAGLISPCSYQRGDHAYLEEDGDAHLFRRAMDAAGRTFSVKERYTNRESRVRSFPGYDPAPYLVGDLLAAQMAFNDARESYFRTLPDGVSTVKTARTPEGEAYFGRMKALDEERARAVDRHLSALEERNV